MVLDSILKGKIEADLETYWRHVRSMYLSKNIGPKHGPFWRWHSTKTTHFVTPGREDLALIASWLDHENCLGGIRLTMAYTSLHHPTPKYVGCCPYMFIYPGIFWLSMTFHSGSSRIQGWFLSLSRWGALQSPSHETNWIISDGDESYRCWSDGGTSSLT